MKKQNLKFVSFRSTAFLAVAVSLPLGSAQAKPITVFFDGEETEVRFPPILRNGRTLVHIREAFEKLGATVRWNPTDQSIKAWRSEDQVDLKIGDPVAQVNGKAVQLDQAPMLHQYPAGMATLVPLRFVSQALGAQVKYDASQHRVDINTGGMGLAEEQAIFKVGDRVELLTGGKWYAGSVLKVWDWKDKEDIYQVEFQEKTGRTLQVTVPRGKLRRGR